MDSWYNTIEAVNKRNEYLMGTYVKKISIDDLAVDMFVEDVFNKDDVLLLSADSIITTKEQIAGLRRQGGIRTV